MSAVWRTRLVILAVFAATVLAFLVPVSASAPADTLRTAPEPVAAAVPAGDPAATLVAAEDTRLIEVLRAIPYRSAPYVDRAHGAPTLVLPPRAAPYDLDALVTLGAAARTGSVVDLGTSVLVAPGAQLRLVGPDTELRLTSGPAGFTSVVAWDADLTVAGTPGHPLRVVSRDPSSGRPDRLPDDGRAYLRAAGGRLAVGDTEFSALGFRSGRTGGLAATGHADTPSAVTVTGTSVRDGEYGLFVTHARSVLVADSVFTGHHADGVRLHRDTRDVVVRHTVASGNGGSGLIADRGSSAVTVEDLDASRNSRWGVAVEASPLSEHPDASGRPTTGTTGFRLRAVRATANLHGGIELDGATDALVTDCAVTAVPVGVFVHGGTRDVEVAGCTVVGAARAGLVVRDGGSGVRLRDNRVGDAVTGIQARDTPVDLVANDLTGVTRHGVSLIGAVGGSTVRDTVVAGSGPSAIDVRRATGAVALVGNRVETWDDDLTWWQWVGRFLAEHVMIGVWFLAILLPLAVGSAIRHRARRRRPASPPLPPRGELTPVVVATEAHGTRVTVLPPR